MSPSERGYIGAASGVKGLTYYYVSSAHISRVELYIDRQIAAVNKELFDKIQNHKTEIENLLGESLLW